MSLSLVHLSDPHFGEGADLHKIVAVENLMPDLQPDVVVISGDLTERAQHGEFQAARAWVRELERTAPVLVVPGDHDLQWWKQPFGKADPLKRFENFTRYFGPVIALKLRVTDAVISGATTTTGLDWLRAVKAPRDAARQGRLDRAEAQRIREAMSQAESGQVKVAVLHHHLIDLEGSQRESLGNARQALSWMSEAGVDLVLCGHAHRNGTDVVNGIVVSVAGTVSTRTPPDVSSSFHRIVVESDSVQVELYQWERDKGRFRRTDVSVFARQRTERGKRIATGTV